MLLGLLVGVDATSDLRAGAAAAHLAVELSIVALALGGAFLLWGQLLAARLHARTLTDDLSRARQDAHRWRTEAQGLLKGLGQAIDRQFERWGLSQAEREVGLLLLKGLSHREIAGLRATSERTVRQQALALYRKAGLGGRAELSAFFLEDLLLPDRPEPSAPPFSG